MSGGRALDDLLEGRPYAKHASEMEEGLGMADDRSDPSHTQPSDAASQAPDFVLALLDELRRNNYHPLGWIRFLGRSWRQSRATAAAHPRLTNSWLGVAAGLTLAEGAALVAEAALGGRAGREAARWAAPGVALALAYTHFDAYVHLGMNNRAAGEPLQPDIGLPTTLTLIRQAIAGYLWGHLVGGRAATPAVALGAMLAAAATDIADGGAARGMGRQSRLGAYMDAEADLSFWLALALTLAARRRAPRWLAPLLIARFIGPFAFALASYFGLAQRLPIGSTVTGKAVGVAQAVAFGAALLPTPARKRIAPALPICHALVAALLIAAPLAQLLKMRRK